MRFTIQRKVFFATLALAASLVALLVVVMKWNLAQGFERYTTAAEMARLDWLVKQIEIEYAMHGNWGFLRDDPERVWLRLSRPARQEDLTRPPRTPRNDSPPEFFPQERGTWDRRPLTTEQVYAQFGPPPGALGHPPPAGSPGRPPPGDVLRIGPRLVLLDTDGKRLAGNSSEKLPAAERPIRYQGAVVGRLGLHAAPAAVTELDSAFLASQTQNVLLAGLAGLGLSFLAAWLLARHMLSPIRDLSDGARRIADGWLDARIPVSHDDELGELAYNFNTMAERLARIEESRRAWIADTSHELRTPLAVLRAEIEAMQDGVRSTDAATLARLHKQVQQLAKLVDDLRLTLEREPGAADMDHTLFSPLVVLDETIAAFRERYAQSGMTLELVGLSCMERQMRGDPGRLAQVFTNVLENTLRYTDSGGRLRISVRTDAKRLYIQFDDTAPAPSMNALPRLFERFFRAEPSRSRVLGGSGLGLAICKSLIEAHGGKISASLSDLGGLAVCIDLPLEPP